MSENKVLLTPRGENVLIEPIIDDEKKTSGGIVLPGEQAKEKIVKGKIVAIGVWIKDTIEDVCVGDTAYFTKYIADEIEYNGNKYLIIKMSLILAIER